MCTELTVNVCHCKLYLSGWCESILCISTLYRSCNSSRRTYAICFPLLKVVVINFFFIFSRKTWRKVTTSSNMNDHIIESEIQTSCLRWEVEAPGSSYWLQWRKSDWFCLGASPLTVDYVKWQNVHKGLVRALFLRDGFNSPLIGVKEMVVWFEAGPWDYFCRQ